MTARLNHQDREDLCALTTASTGAGSARIESKNKRPREEDRPAGGSRHFRPSIATPFNNLGQDDLNKASRSNNRGTNSSVTSSRRTHSRPSGLQHNLGTPRVAATIFGKQPEKSGNHSFVAEPRSGLLALHDGGLSPASGSSFKLHASTTQPEGLSDKANRVMSGEGEKFTMAQLMDIAFLDSPQQGHRAESSTPNGRTRSSSADPINLITTPDADPMVIDDDLSDEVVEVILPGQLRPATPKKETMFHTGHVREVQATLEGYLQGNLPSASNHASETTAKSKASSKGNAIIPGLTRKPTSQPPQPAGGVKISSRMNKKPDRDRGLKIATKGAKANTQERPPSPKLPDSNRQAKLAAPPPAEIKIKIREWYCGNEHYGQTRREQYRFCCAQNQVSLGQIAQLRSEPLTLLWGDFKGFEIVESSEDANTEEFIPALQFFVNEKRAASKQWRKFSGGENSSRMLVVFDASDEIFADNWPLLIDRLAKLTNKSFIKANAMNAIIKSANEGRSITQQSIKSFSSRPSRADQRSDLETTPPIVPPNMSESAALPATKPRTRAATRHSNDGKDQTPQVPRLPLQDPDEIMLVYPQSGTGAVNINRAELARLEPNEFLNDTLIELGLKLWINDLRTRDPELVDQIHIFNSFFFKKIDGGRGKACDYNSVKKWTSKIDLFKKKFIIVPINEHLHWYLAIICFPEHVLRAPPPQPTPQPSRTTRSSNAASANAEEPRVSPESDVPNIEPDLGADAEAGSPLALGQPEVDADLANQSESMIIDVEMTPPPLKDGVNTNAGGTGSRSSVLDMTQEDLDDRSVEQSTDNANGQKCWIVIFDSLKGKHNRTVRLLREYLQAEAQERHGKIVETKDTKLSGGLIEDKHLPAPEQPNWCDCGVYLLHYVETFVANPFKLLVLPPKRKLNADLYDKLWRKEEVDKKRDDFRDKVNRLSVEWREFKSKGAQAPRDNAPTTGQLASNAPHESSLLIVGAEPSLIEIAPPNLEMSLREPVNGQPSPPRLGPRRSGMLPPLTDDPPRLPPTEDLVNSLAVDDVLPLPIEDEKKDESEVEVEVEFIGEDDETRRSEDQSSSTSKSNTGKPTRRGKKGGARHPFLHSPAPPRPQESPEL